MLIDVLVVYNALVLTIVNNKDLKYKEVGFGEIGLIIILNDAY